MDGILCINKPEGFTSFDVVAKLRGILKMKKIGHAGTLDPMATGVLPVFVGCATKACDILPVSHKAYQASFELGTSTDTQDSTGRVLSTNDMDISQEKLMNAAAGFLGETDQIPPMYSAVSVNGKRLYELARQGIEVERKPRRIIVSSLDIKEYDCKTRTGIMSIECSKGTYIRTIINDIGEVLGCGAMMTGLVRTMSNGFTLDNCYSLDQVQDMVSKNEINDKIIPVQRIFESFPYIKLNNDETFKYKNGVKISLEQLSIQQITDDKKLRIFADDDQFLGLGMISDGMLKVYKNFTVH